MSLSDFPPPAHYPVFMPHHYVLKYLQLYTDKFGLAKYIHFNSPVTSVKQSPDFDQTGRWVVTVQHATTKQVSSLQTEEWPSPCLSVIVALILFQL